MKKNTLTISAIVILALSSCMSVEPIGSLNMVSTRNIDASKQYEFKLKSVSLSKQQLRKEGGLTIQDAIDEAVRRDSTGSGEYLMNARIYYVRKDYFFFYLSHYNVEGDVWGEKK